MTDALAVIPPTQVRLLSTTTAPLQQFLQGALQQLMQAGDDDESLWALSDLGDRLEMAGRLIAGLANRELSRRLNDVELGDELKRRSKTRSSFFYSIDILAAYEALPSHEAVCAIAQLGYSKSRELLTWKPEERLALAQGEPVRGLTLDQAVSLPTRAFEKLVKQLPDADAAQKIEELEADLADSNAKIDGYEVQIKQLKAVGTMTSPVLEPAFAALRDEALFLTTKMAEAVMRLRSEADRLLLLPNWRELPNAPDRMSATGSLYHMLNGVLAMGAELLGNIDARYSGAVTGSLHPLARYTADEAERVKAIRECAVQAADAEIKTVRASVMNQHGVAGKRPKVPQ